jgi:hypothetical protein
MLVAIAATVEEHQMLAAGVLQGSVVLVLDRDRDSIEQITEALHRHPTVTSLHLVCHGSPGCLDLGNTCLSLDTLVDYAPQLQTWFSPESHRKISPSLLIYGCNVAAGDAGMEFVERLHQLTGAPVAASATPIGSRTQGGNWQLDVTTGDVEVVLGFQPQVMAEYASIFAAGYLDLSFGNGGKVLTDFNLGTDAGYTRISHKRVSRGEKEVIQPINWSWWRQTDPTRVEMPGEPVNFPIHPRIEDEKSVIQTAQRRGADSPWHCSH